MDLLDPAKLNRRITIEQKSATLDAWGQPGDTWATVATVWAWPKTQTGMGVISAERQAGGTQVSVVPVSFRIRWRAGITAGMRVSYGGAVYDIKQVVYDEAGRGWTDLVCATGANSGG